MALRPSTRTLHILGLTNSLAIAHALLYGALAIATGSKLPVPGAWIFVLGPVTFAGCSLISYAGKHLLLGSLDRAVTALRECRTPEPEDLGPARRQALRLPILAARTSFIFWIISVVVLAAAAQPLEPTLDPLALIHTALVLAVIASVSNIVIYYLTESYSRRALVPLLVPDGRLSRIGVPPVTIVFKLGVLLVSTVLLPILLITTAAITGVLGSALVVFIAISYVSFGIFQSWFIVRSIHRPVEELAAQVGRVARGDLSAHATVVSVDRIGELGEGFNEMVEGLRRAEFVKDTFGRYVSPAIAKEILEGNLALGGELRTATVLFSDIRGFTAMSERLSPADVVRVLNRYLDRMVELVVAHGGNIDKFVGDAVMATFGIPISRPPEEHARAAVECALGMLDALAALNATRGPDVPALDIGIGIHTGELIAGNIGSTRKLEYTVIGDTVNTASRIESLNKTLGTRLLVSAETFALVASGIEARTLPPVEVKGKSEPLAVFEVLARRAA